MPSPILQVAAKAVIFNQAGDILILREATGVDNTQAGKWGLAGGRLEPGESFADGLAREVTEETGLRVEIGQPMYVGEWHPKIRGVPHQIIGIFMLCTALTSKVRLSEEHDSFAWITPADYTNFTMMDPDDLVIRQCINQK